MKKILLLCETVSVDFVISHCKHPQKNKNIKKSEHFCVLDKNDQTYIIVQVATKWR